MAKDNSFIIEFDKFYQGASPAAHLDNLTELGNSGQYSTAVNIDIISNPNVLTQGPALANLTNGTQDGVVSELINYILDEAVASDVTFAVGATKLFKLSSSTVISGGSPSWPVTITNATDGESCIELGGNLYTFYNKSSGGDISKYDLSITLDHDWGSTVPTGAVALQSALHPIAKKEDIMVFGNGRYLGVYTNDNTTINVTKLDFGANTEVADVLFHANQWWIAVNSGISGTNRNTGRIFVYDGSATSNLLSDETGIGPNKIGFLYVLNGIVYVVYQDLSFSGGYIIGYIFGRQIYPLAYFTGSLPGYNQKTLYKNTILFLASGLIYSVGSIIPAKLPNQISQLADGGYTTCGAIAAPFGIPMITSSDGGGNFRLAKFSGYDTACSWKSAVVPIAKGNLLGQIDEVTVLTKTLGANARCDLQLEYNQNSSNSGIVKQITGTGQRRFIFHNFGGLVEDLRLFLDWSNGSVTNDCPIRRVRIEGHYAERLN